MSTKVLTWEMVGVWRKEVWHGGQKGRSRGNLGKQRGVTEGSGPWNLHALTSLLSFCSFCCSAVSAIHHINDFYHLNNFHLFLLIIYPRICCEGMQHLQSNIAKQCSRWDTLLDTMHGISPNPPPSQPLQRAGRWFAPVQPQHYITAKGALHFTSYCAPGVKVTWWMTGQSDRLSDTARPRRPGGRMVSRTGPEGDIAIRGKKVAWGLTTDGGRYNAVLWVFHWSLDRINQSS